MKLQNLISSLMYAVYNKHNKTAQLLIVKTCYSLYSSRCSTDLQGHPSLMIFVSSESQYVTSY